MCFGIETKVLIAFIKEPEWLNDIVGDEDGDGDNTGRTYLATKALDGDEGAFAYLAVSLSDNEPRWLGGGEGYVACRKQVKTLLFFHESKTIFEIFAEEVYTKLDLIFKYR